MTGSEYDNADREKIKLNLNVVRSYGNDLTHAIQRMKAASGCQNEQTSAENIYITSAYVNDDAPVDKTCHLFDVSGGGLDWQEPPGYLFPKASDDWWRESYAFTDGVRIPELGTEGAELLLVMEVRSPAQCEIINDILHQSLTIPEATSFCLSPFTGAFTSACGGGIQNWTNVAGWSEGCVKHQSEDEYYYYRTLVKR